MSGSSHDQRERRVQPRLKVGLQVRFELAELPPIDSAILDLCLAGAYLSIPGATALPAPPFRGRVRLKLSPSGTPLDLRAEVLRREPDGIGIRFIDLSPADQSQLRAFLADQAAHPAAEAGGAAVASAAEALKLLQRLSLQRLPAMVQVLQDAWSEALWQASESAPSNSERSALSGDIAQLDKAMGRQQVQETMRRVLLDPMLRAGGASRPPEAAAANAPLELLDTDRFEVWLAGAALANSLEQRLEEPLRELRELARGAVPDRGPLPVEPQGMAQALEETLSNLGLRPFVKVMCLRRSAASLAVKLEAFYRELIDLWLNAGFRPAPALAPQPKPQPRPRPGRRAPERLQPAGKPIDAEPVAVRSAAGKLARRLHRLPWSATVADGRETGLKQRVLELLGEDGESAEAALGAAEGERIDATDRVLHHMLGDPGVPDGLKDLIHQLSLRFLALSLENPNFYGRSSHPLLGMLNRLEHLAMLAPDSEDLEQLLRQALETDVRDTESLRLLSGRAQALEQRHSVEYRANAERLVAGYEGRERLKEAREQVRRRVNRSLAGRPAHRAVVRLLEQGWRSLLELTYVRQGGKGAGWRRWWQTLLAVHGYCGGETPPNKEPLPGREQTAENLREGLEYIGFDPFHRGSLLDDLQSAMGAAQQGEDALMPFPEFPPERQPEAQLHGIAAQNLAKVDHLPVGSALHVQDEGRESVHRLLWRSGDGSELLFVDARDLKPHPVRRVELAGRLQRGEVRLQPPVEQPLTQRAAQNTVQEMQERIGYHESRDPLTGLSNRNRLTASLTRLLTIDPTEFVDSVLGFVGLDHFEALTGSCGFNAGERMLVAVAKLLENSLEDALCIAYLGGSRFGFLVKTEDESGARRIGAEVLGALSEFPFYWNGMPYPVVASLGLAMVGLDSDNPETLLSAADSACYAAQAAGGNRVLLFREGDETIARQKSAMDGWVRAEGVVKSRRLRLRSQCIAPADPAQPSPHHHEILLSVYDDSGAPLPLDEFISAAEAFNLMADMDRLVLEEAFKWVQGNPGKAAALGGIAINLSGQSLDREGLVDTIEGLLDRFQVPPQQVSFEVTETAAITSLERAVATIEGIHALGCRFALDDFGSGMSSYSYLKRLPVDYLKIDGAFVKDMLRNPHDMAIVKSINEIAHFMGKQTIAEYVETPEIRERLVELGVDYVQGYAVERPGFLDEIRRPDDPQGNT
jgi:diguanylate cyclase (GGDEF)-like protein